MVAAGALALLIAFGGPVTTTFAQETEPSTTPTTTPSAPVEPGPTETTTPSETTPSTPSETSTTPTETTQPQAPSPTSEVPPPPAEQQNRPDQNKPGQQKAAPDAKVTVAFSQAEYLPDTALPITVTVENIGDATADDIGFLYDDQQVWLESGLDELTAQPGPSLAPGQQKVIQVVARPRDILVDSVKFSVGVHVRGDPNHSNDVSAATARVVQKRGSFSGTAYSDANGNGRLDAGEGVSGLQVSTYGGSPLTFLGAITDADGRFSFTDVPAGKYVISFQHGGDVVVKPGSSEFVVEEGRNTELEIAAVRPVADVLDASLALDKDTYVQGEAINVKITLVNKGTAPLTGVVAVCNHSGETSVLSGTGPGWAPLAVGAGIDLAAGETKVLNIPDVVPDGAFNIGKVYAECNFGNNGAHENGYVGSSDSADVTGAVGHAKGLLVHDKNNDNNYEGEGLPGVKIVALHPKTRQVVGRTVTDAAGNWSLRDLPVGTVPMVVLGPWKDRYNGDGFNTWIVGGQEGTSIFSVVPGPEVVDPARPDLKVTAVLDKPHYNSNETVKATVTVHNQSAVPAERVHSGFASGLNIDPAQWGDLDPGKPGVRIEPGATLTIPLSGSIRTVDSDGKLQFWGSVKSDDGDANDQDNFFFTTATVTQVRGDVSGVVYTDKNRNGMFDSGEGASDAKVSLYGGSPSGYHERTTDAGGRFSFDDIPTGDYGAYYTLAGGWIVRWSDATNKLTVDPVKPLELSVGAVRPLAETMRATMSLDQDIYQVGDIAQVTITLTNTDDRTVSGIKAGCNRIGNPNQLGHGPGWGDLGYDGSGVTLAAGETKTIKVSEEVPAAALTWGSVAVACDFEPNADYDADGPSAHDSARVPGAFGEVEGQLAHDKDGDFTVDPGEGIAGTTIILLDAETGAPTARGVTDAGANFEFRDVPAGLYRAVIVGPWKFGDEYGGHVMVFGGDTARVTFFVEPGPEVTDPGVVTPPPAAGGTPPPAGARKALATTGASVLGLSVLGLIMLAFGIGARTAGRRRQAI